MKPATPNTLIADVLGTYREQRSLEVLIEEGKRHFERSGDATWAERVEQDTQRLNNLVAFRDQVSTFLGGLGERRTMDREAVVGQYVGR